MTQVAIELLIILALLLTNGVLAMTEMSLVSARKARLQALAQRGNNSARIAVELAQSPNQFLSTVQIGITLVGILAGAFGGATIAQFVATQFVALGLSPAFAKSASFAVVVVGITYFSLVIGELVPKRLALSSPERFACLLAGPMRRLSALTRPAVAFLGWSTDFILRALGVNRESTSEVTDDEVRVLMQEGSAAGVFHRAEPQMVARVLELDDLQVKEIMTPRPKVIFVSADEPHERVWHKIVASRHSFFPVFQGNRDHIVGVVSVKAIYANLAAGAAVHVSALMTKAHFVPATQSVVQLLESFRATQNHFAIVADEFGSVVGVVTLVDVLEAIVGHVPSQEARLQPEIRRREDGTWLIDGMLDIEAIEEALPTLRFPAEPDRSYQTLAGFILEHLGRIPDEGDVFTAFDWTFEIIDMDRPRIDKVLLRPAASK